MNQYKTVEADTIKVSFVVIQNLQKFLEPRTFAVSNHVTLADLYLFALLHGRVTQLDDNEKNQFNNVYRWYKHIQSLEGVHNFLAREGISLVRETQLSVPFLAVGSKKKK